MPARSGRLLSSTSSNLRESTSPALWGLDRGPSTQAMFEQRLRTTTRQRRAGPGRPDFLSGGWPEECRRCGHLDSEHTAAANTR